MKPNVLSGMKSPEEIQFYTFVFHSMIQSTDIFTSFFYSESAFFMFQIHLKMAEVQDTSILGNFIV